MYGGIDPEQDQRLIQRHGVAQRLEDRSIKTDQGKPFRALPAERVERERSVPLERLQGRLKVARTLLEAHEAKDGQRVGERPFVALHTIDQPGHAARISQEERQHGRIPRGDFLLRRRQPGDLGDQRCFGRCRRRASGRSTRASGAAGRPPRRCPSRVAQPAKFVGMLLVKEDRLDVQPIEQHQPAQAVGLFDRLGIPPKPIGHPGDQLAIRCSGRLVFGEQMRLGSVSTRSDRRTSVPVPRRAGAPDAGASAVPAGLNASLNSTASAATNTAMANIRFIEGLIPRSALGRLPAARLDRK